MTTKHTPGPWHIADMFPASKLKAEKHEHFYLRGIGNGATHVGYASVTQITSGGESEANARLIASAPELLAALVEAEAVLNTARQYFPKSIQNADRFHLLNVLENSVGKAIAKAKGPQ